MRLNHRKYRLRKEGAQIYGEETMAVLLYKMSMSHIDDYSWNKSELQDHIIIPEIGHVLASRTFTGEIRYAHEDQNANVLLWLSLLERFCGKTVRMEARTSFSSETGLKELKKCRVATYTVVVESLCSYLELYGEKEFSRHQKRNMKSSFEDFVEQIKEYNEVSVVKEKRDKKDSLVSIVIEISTARYFKVNEFLYDKIIFRSKNDFRSIRNSIGVFIAIMKNARKSYGDRIVDSEKTNELKLHKAKILVPEATKSQLSVFSGLSYRKIESNVCFSYLKNLADRLQLNRKTIANQIQFLSDSKIISYVVVRDWNNTSERYFITDSFSESYLADYVLYEYRSSNAYDVIEISSCYGRAYSYESSNTPSSENLVDINTPKFNKARRQFFELNNQIDNKINRESFVTTIDTTS